MRARRQRVYLLDEVLGRAGDATEDAHDEAELVGRPQQAHVDQWRGVVDVAGVEAFHLRPRAGAGHGFQEIDDVAEGVGEDVVVIERLVLGRVDGVVHAAHVERGHVGTQGGDVGDALLAADADRAGGVVDDHIGTLAADGGVDAGVGVHVVGGPAVVLPGVDVDNTGPGRDAAAGLLGDLVRRIGDGGRLGAGGQDAGQGSGEDGFGHHKG